MDSGLKNRLIIAGLVLVSIVIGLGLAHHFIKQKVDGNNELDDESVISTIGEHEIFVADFKQALRRYMAQIGSSGSIQSELSPSARVVSTFFKSYVEKRIFLLEAETQGVKVTQEEVDAKIKTIHTGFNSSVFMNTFDEEGLSYEDWKNELKEQMAIDKLMLKLVDQSIKVSDEELKNYYDMNPDEFASEEAIKACHWLKKGEDEAKRFVKELKDKMSKVEKASPTTHMPKVFCNPNEGTAGGFLTRDDLTEKMWEPLHSLATGEVSLPIKSEFGYHIFMVMEKRSEGVLSFKEVKPRIEEALKEEMIEKRYSEVVEELKKKWPVKVNHSALSSVL